MAAGRGIKPMPLDVPILKWDSFDPARFVVQYDKKADILYAHTPKPRRATSIDIDEEVWINVDLETGEIVGIQIDDFELVFLKKHPEVAAVWPGAKPRASDRVTFFLTIILEFLRSLVGESPQQPRLLQNHS